MNWSGRSFRSTSRTLFASKLSQATNVASGSVESSAASLVTRVPSPWNSPVSSLLINVATTALTSDLTLLWDSSSSGLMSITSSWLMNEARSDSGNSSDVAQARNPANVAALAGTWIGNASQIRCRDARADFNSVSMFLDLEVNRSLSQESAFFNILIEDASKAKGRLVPTGSIGGPRPRRNSPSPCAVNHGDPEVGMDTDLAGEADVGCDISFAGQAGLLDLGLRPGVATQDLDPAGRAAGIAAASVHDVDSRVFDGQNQLLARLDLKRFLTVNGHGWHDLGTPLGYVEQRAGAQLARAAGPVIGLGRCSNLGNSAATESLAFKICRGGWRCKAWSTIARGAFALRRSRPGGSSRVVSTSSSDVSFSGSRVPVVSTRQSIPRPASSSSSSRDRKSTR